MADERSLIDDSIEKLADAIMNAARRHRTAPPTGLPVPVFLHRDEHEEDYRAEALPYVLNATKTVLSVEGCSTAAEALEEILVALKALRLATGYDDMDVQDDTGDLDPDEEREYPDPTEPEPGDWLIGSTGPLGSQTRVFQIGNDDYDAAFVEEDDAFRYIKCAMETQEYWPNVWRNDDHGGLTLLRTEDFPEL